MTVEVRVCCRDGKGGDCRGVELTLHGRWLDVLREALAESIPGWRLGDWVRQDRQDLLDLLRQHELRQHEKHGALRRPPRSR